MAKEEGLPKAPADTDGTDMRLLVLEMTVAAVAARLPRADFEEIVSMLVFVANSSGATLDLENIPAEAAALQDASRYATDMLDRIAQSRKGDRTTGRH